MNIATQSRTALALLGIALATTLTVGAFAAKAEKPAAPDRGSAPLDRLMGFGRGTTGAGTCGADGSCVCHVRNLTETEFSQCVSGDEPKLVVFDKRGSIDVDRINIGSNKTIQGPVTLTGDHKLLEINGSSNVIIRNVTLHSSLRDLTEGSNCAHPARPRDVSGCGVMLSIRGNSRKIWVDHNEFYECGDKCITVWAYEGDGVDKAGRVVSPDLVTISNNILRDNFYAVLIGVDAHVEAAQMPKQERVTLYGNLFRNINRRSPRVASGAWAHVFNNLITNWGGDGPCVGAGYGFGASANGSAQLLAEKNYFAAKPFAGSCHDAIEISEKQTIEGSDRGMGFVRALDNTVENGAQIAENASQSVFNPASGANGEASYNYTALPARDVKAYVLAHAGPR